MGMDGKAVRTLATYNFKTKVPEHAAQVLAESVGAIFSEALDAGSRATITALREAADALERGMAISAGEAARTAAATKSSHAKNTTQKVPPQQPHPTAR